MPLFRFVLTGVVAVAVIFSARASLGHEPAPAPSTQLWGGAPHGPYQVTFSMLHLEDTARAYGSLVRRPISLSIWQPLQTGMGPFPPLPLAGYVVAYRMPPSIGPTAPKVDSRVVLKQFQEEWFPSAPQAAVQELLNTPFFASRDTPPAAGKFPLVVYAPGYGQSPLEHIAMAEFMASHGYVVVMSPSQGDSPSGMTFDAFGLEDQARDLAFAAGALRNRPNVDPDKIALVGSGFGGAAAIIAAMQIRGVTAVASLDGTLFSDVAADMVRSTPDYDPALLRVPFLAMTPEGTRENLGLVRTLVLSDRQVIRFRDATNKDFTPVSVLRARVGGNEKALVFPEAAKTLLRFLEEHVKAGDSSLHAYFKTEELNSRQAGQPSSELLLPRIDAPTRQELVTAVLENSDVESLVKAQTLASRQSPGLCLLSAGTLHMLGMKLAERGERDKAIEVYQLLVILYPRDFFALNQLGDFYREKKDMANATRYYRQSLGVRAGNQGAVEGLDAGRR